MGGSKVCASLVSGSGLAQLVRPQVFVMNLGASATGIAVRNARDGGISMTDPVTPNRLLSPEQAAWLGDLSRCSVETYTWRPADLEVVAAVLAGRSRDGDGVGERKVAMA